MKSNKYFTVGIFDRIARLIFGVALIALALNNPTETDWFARLIIIAVYPLLTALVAWDPVYAFFEIVRDRMFAEQIHHH
jgi:hypothetical protein